MKKLFAFLAVAFALTLGAAPERFSVLRLADGATLTNAAARLGAQIELPQFQDLVGSLIMFSEARGLFGPEREGAPSAYIGYVPAGEGPLSPASLGEQALVALMYPTAQSRAAFREKFPGVDETNGVMRLVSQEDGVSVTNYIAYAEDGRWVAAAPIPELATLALAETNKLEKADLQGNLIDFTLEDNMFARLLAGSLNNASPEAFKGAGAFKFGFRADERGLDVQGTLATAKGSYLERLGRQKLAGKPLAFADKDALWACETANATSPGGRGVSGPDMRRLFAEEGFKLDALRVDETNGATFVSLDFARLIADNRTNNWLATAQRIASKLANSPDKVRQVPTNAAGAKVAFTLKGAKGLFTPAQRFAAVLPEDKDRPLCAAYAGSPFGLLKIAAALCVRETVTKSDAVDMISMMLTALPVAQEGGFAGAVWQDDEGFRFHYRMTASELKGISALVQLGLAFAFSDAVEDELLDEEEEPIDEEDEPVDVKEGAHEDKGARQD